MNLLYQFYITKYSVLLKKGGCWDFLHIRHAIFRLIEFFLNDPTFQQKIKSDKLWKSFQVNLAFQQHFAFNLLEEGLNKEPRGCSHYLKRKQWNNSITHITANF